MKHPLAGDEQVVRDDSAVAPPPDCLRAHYSATPNTAQFAQPREAGTKAAAHRIVGVVVKSLVFPEGIDVGRTILCARAAHAEFRDLIICNLKIRQGSRKALSIELRICPRPRDSAHIDDDANFRSGEQFDEFSKRVRGMANGEERIVHAVHCAFEFAHYSQPRCLSTVALCKATWSVLSLFISYCGSSGVAWCT